VKQYARVVALFVAQLGKWARLTLEANVDMLRVNLGPAPKRAKHPTHRNRLLRDRIAEREIRNELVHAAHRQSRRPDGAT
jgi:hypothetical protein